MVYMEIKPGYNSVWVMGDSERITVITHRSSTDVFRTTITRNPKFLEKVFPACYEQGLFCYIQPKKNSGLELKGR
jgi:hypothetical protein